MLTNYAGLSPPMKYFNKIELGQQLNRLFPTVMHNATKFTNAQVIMWIILASFSGVNRIIKIANFAPDSLVMALLGLEKNLNKDVISTRLKELGQKGAYLLQEFNLGLTNQCNGWNKSRKLRAIRTRLEWQIVDYFGQRQRVPVYEYACYCSNLKENAFGLHQIDKKRSESKTRIEQVKSQLLASKTLTDNFHANDILWQLNAMAYNLSVMMRYKLKKFWKEEHATFRDWFINIPGKLVKKNRRL